MKILHGISKRKIHTAECDRLRIQIAMLHLPKNTFRYAFDDLALAVIETKIAIWRAVCH